MGQAKLRRQQAQARQEQVLPAAARAGAAIRKLAMAGAWPEKLFSRFREAVEFTALQRGVER